jgi:Holliday junction DNA helicase RuvA
MIAFIEGEIMQKTAESVIIAAGGIGYEIQMPASDLQKLPGTGAQARIHTYLYIHEDVISLFGFLSRDELALFRQLITVSGIGPKIALGILAALSTDELRMAIVAEDARTIAKAPGIGTKTARKLILELKDKVGEQMAEAGDAPAAVSVQGSDAVSDAVQALVSLGYSQTEAARAVMKIEGAGDMDAETLLKLALRNTSIL